MKQYAGAFAKEVMETLYEYVEAKEAQYIDAVDKATKQCIKNIKAKAPKDTGNYRSGWRRRKLKDGKEILIYNEKAPQLTHLLEHGHAKVNGGRVPGQPHLAQAEKEAIDQILSELRKNPNITFKDKNIKV